MEEFLKAQLKEKEDICNTLKSEIVHLGKKLDKSTRISTTLDEILNHQETPYDRMGLGYNEKKEESMKNHQHLHNNQENKEPRTMLTLS
jgi:hypothetical protein